MMRSPFTKVPLCEPMSRTAHVAPKNSKTAWVRETLESSIEMSFDVSAPTVTRSESRGRSSRPALVQTSRYELSGNPLAER